MPLTDLAGRRGLFIGVGGEHSAAWRCARRMASLGARLALSGAAPGPPHAGTGLGLPMMPCDVREPLQVRAVVEQAARQLGGFDFVVHSMPETMPPALQDDSSFEPSEGLLRSMRLYCMSFAETARLCVPHMQHGGAVVSLYAGARARAAEPAPLSAVRDSILRYLALELEPWSIRVLCLEPGGQTAEAPGLPKPVRHTPGHAWRRGSEHHAVVPEKRADAVWAQAYRTQR